MLANKKIITTIVVTLMCILAATVPVLLAFYVSTKHAEEAELERIENYASEMLRLTIDTGKQLTRVFETFEGNVAPLCSFENRQKMLQLQMTSSLIQAVAAVRDNRLMCTTHELGVQQDLGQPDGTTKRGTRFWINAKLNFVPGKTFNIYENNGFAAILPKDQVVNIFAHESNLSLATALTDPLVLLRSRGGFNDAWLQHYIDTGELRFQMDGYSIVASVYDSMTLVALVALPVADVAQRFDDIAYVVIPLGVVIGGFLCVMVFCLARHRVSVEGDIKNALKNDEFFMTYQPVVDLQSGQIIGVESLIRWRDTDGNIISPDFFIPIAEERNLICDITKRVFELITMDAQEIWLRYPDFHMGINLSSQDLQNHQTVLLLSEFIQKTNPREGTIIVEATERGFVDASKARSVIHALHGLGVKVAVDDFGTGYSSLSYLETLDLDFLKIDKSFIDSLGTEAATSSVALHIIEMAKSLQLTTIAEGVETEPQMAFLRKRGVHFAQGWYFGKPMELGDLLALLEQQQNMYQQVG